MQKYPVKTRGHPPLTLERIEAAAQAQFDSARRAGDAVETSFGAIARLRASVEGKELVLDLTMNPKVEPTLQAETIGRYNRFLQELTGFSAKERARKMRKSAGADDSAG